MSQSANNPHETPSSHKWRTRSDSFGPGDLLATGRAPKSSSTSLTFVRKWNPLPTKTLKKKKKKEKVPLSLKKRTLKESTNSEGWVVSAGKPTKLEFHLSSFYHSQENWRGKHEIHFGHLVGSSSFPQTWLLSVLKFSFSL